jgi:hypothetical protein
MAAANILGQHEIRAKLYLLGRSAYQFMALFLAVVTRIVKVCNTLLFANRLDNAFRFTKFGGADAEFPAFAAAVTVVAAFPLAAVTDALGFGMPCGVLFFFLVRVGGILEVCKPELKKTSRN